MGGGAHGGFGFTEGSSDTEENLSAETSENSGEASPPSENTVSLPNNDSQLKHIFGNRPGHLPDTPANRKMLEDLARDKTKYMGTDKYGNSWNVSLNDNGTQTWVRYQNGVINEGGLNQTPKPWDDETGLNKNPFK